MVKGVMFDEHGKRVEVSNIDIFVTEMKDKLLIDMYRFTIYQHELIIAMEELVEKGLVKRNLKSDDYNTDLTDNSINTMKNEIIGRFDNDFHDEVIKSIDLSFLNKKPKNL